MKSPISPHVSERETIASRLALPTARVFMATVILATGTGVAAVFWKMPNVGELHALYHEEIVDKELAAVPLPNETVAALSLEEMQQITLPRLGMAPVAADGRGRYAQAYPAPASLAIANVEQDAVVQEEEEPSFTATVPQRFEPMRQVIDEKSVSVEPINREFPPMPTSVGTAERSDDLMATFHFVENSRVEQDATHEQPSDPFPVVPAPTPAVSTLQPLQPLELGRLSPLLPFEKIDM